MKTKNGKTISQMLSTATARMNWLKKLKNNVDPVLRRLDSLFRLPRNVYHVPKENVLTLEYIGDTDSASVLKARERIEKVFNAPLGDDNKITAKCGRITITFTLANFPSVEVRKAA